MTPLVDKYPVRAEIARELIRERKASLEINQSREITTPVIALIASAGRVIRNNHDVNIVDVNLCNISMYTA